MAVGWTPKYSTSFLPGNLDEGQSIILAIETAIALKWKFSFFEDKGFIAHSKISLASWGEKIKVQVENGTIEITSKCSGSQFFDWDKNKRNVENFISTFDQLKSQFSKEELSNKLIEFKKNVQKK